MVAILKHLHQYVPYVTYSETKSMSSGEKEELVKAKFHRVLVGGNQLTAARARHLIKAKVNSQTPIKQLKGIIPVVEDWHTKANFLGVRYNYYDTTTLITIIVASVEHWPVEVYVCVCMHVCPVFCLSCPVLMLAKC